jgi:hypothetical protein
MTVIRNPASPGSPSQVVAESPIRNPIAGIPFRNHETNPALGLPFEPPARLDAIEIAVE